jgi:hypothetical protein
MPKPLESMCTFAPPVAKRVAKRDRLHGAICESTITIAALPPYAAALGGRYRAPKETAFQYSLLFAALGNTQQPYILHRKGSTIHASVHSHNSAHVRRSKSKIR